MKEIPTFVQVSGGRTSGMMAYLLRDKPNHFFCFQNTGREAKVTYDFLNRMDKEWGLNLIWLEYSCPDRTQEAVSRVVNYETADRKGKPFSELNDKRQAIPNKAMRFCTIELKIKTMRRYIREQGINKWNYSIGFRLDEPHRQTVSDTMQKVITPLRDLGVTAKDVAEFWKAQPFDLDLPIMPNGKTFGGNCEGCFWHSEYQHAHLAKNNPESYDWLVNQEKKHGYTFNSEYSYEQLKQHVENTPEFIFDLEDALCQTTNGSCGV